MLAQTRFLPLVVALLTLCAPATLAAQDKWDQQVRAELGFAQIMFEMEGYELSQPYQTGSMVPGARSTLDISLQRDTEYLIVAACDADCSDIDLLLSKLDGIEIDRDFGEDAVPIVEVNVSSSGLFRLRVDMVACSAAPCRYGVAVLGRPTTPR